MKRHWIPRTIAGIPLVLVAFGCAERAREAAVGDGLGGPDVTLKPVAADVFTVGAIDGEDWATFGRVASVSFDQAGSLYILDPDASRITVVGSDGAFIRSIGKAGGGPGEFQVPYAAAVFPSGRLAVFDLGKRGFQVFDPSGAYVESVPVDMSAGAPGSLMIPLADGRLVSAGGFRMSFGSGPPDTGDFMGGDEGRPVDRFSLDDGGHDVWYRAWKLQQAPEGEARTLEGEGGGISFTMGTRAFEPSLYFGVLSDGRVAVVDSTGYRVKIIDGEGSVVGTLERPIEPTVLTGALRDAERGRRLAALEDQGGGRMVLIGGGGGMHGGGGGMQIDQDQMRQMMEEQIGSMYFAEVVPVISGFAIDEEDRLWVQRFGQQGQEEGPTDIITAEGKYFGTVPPGVFPTPDAFGPNGLVAYIEADDLGVQTVRVARLEPF